MAQMTQILQRFLAHGCSPAGSDDRLVLDASQSLPICVICAICGSNYRGFRVQSTKMNSLPERRTWAYLAHGCSGSGSRVGPRKSRAASQTRAG